MSRVMDSAPAAIESGPARRDDWTRAPERSNALALRAMCWIATALGRGVARLVLHPIALYFLLFSPAQRRYARFYLNRALARPATSRDLYRLFHAFASTVLDRVYLLRNQIDLLDLDVQGHDFLKAVLAEGRGAFMLGAHLGSFEAIAAIGRGDGSRFAMVMFPDNARRINAALQTIAPEAATHIIALGRPNAMIAIRDWLDSGGLAGMLSDRTLPVGAGPDRGGSAVVDFLGSPARFSDGPFRLAALLRRRVIFMSALYCGGARYDVQFDLLADFQDCTAEPSERERLIRAALEAYVRRLEALCRRYPYNWFNFHDFWQDDAIAGK